MSRFLDVPLVKLLEDFTNEVKKSLTKTKTIEKDIR